VAAAPRLLVTLFPNTLVVRSSFLLTLLSVLAMPSFNADSVALSALMPIEAPELAFDGWEARCEGKLSTALSTHTSGGLIFCHPLILPLVRVISSLGCKLPSP